METRLKSLFEKNFSNWIKHLISSRYSSMVSLCYLVEGPIVNDTSQLSTIFYEEQWGTIDRLTSSQYSNFQQVFNVLSASSFFCRGADMESFEVVLNLFQPQIYVPPTFLEEILLGTQIWTPTYTFSKSFSVYHVSFVGILYLLMDPCNNLKHLETRR